MGDILKNIIIYAIRALILFPFWFMLIILAPMSLIVNKDLEEVKELVKSIWNFEFID